MLMKRINKVSPPLTCNELSCAHFVQMCKESVCDLSCCKHLALPPLVSEGKRTRKRTPRCETAGISLEGTHTPRLMSKANAATAAGATAAKKEPEQSQEASTASPLSRGAIPFLGGASRPAAAAGPVPMATDSLFDKNQTKKSPSLMEKNNFVPGIYGTSLPLNSFAHQTQHNCGMDSDVSAENKLSSPGDKIVTRGVLASTFYKDHYKAAVEQLAALSLSKNTRTAQLNSNSNRHSWSYISHKGSNAVSRDFSKTFAVMPSSSSHTPIRHINTNPAPIQHRSVSYPGTQQTVLENCSRNGDGDFFRKAHEAPASNSYPATDSSGDDMLSVMKLNWKTENSHGEDNLLAEKKDASEGSKNSSVLLKYFKNADLKLRPEPIEDIETSSSPEYDTFSYPDFLPAPYNTLDLQKMSLSKWDDWKLSFEPPPEESLDQLISRLVEMERLQHLTILKERTKEASVSPTTAPNNRPSSTKDMYQLKQLKATDIFCPQAAFDGDFHNFGSRVQEPDVLKCTCHHCQHKWNSGPVFPLRSKHLRASCNKCTKAPVILDSSNMVAHRSLSCSSSGKIRSAVKMPSPNTPAFSLPDSEKSKCKEPRTRRKSYRKNVTLIGKPFNSQRLKSLSVLAKPKYTQVDHQ